MVFRGQFLVFSIQGLGFRESESHRVIESESQRVSLNYKFKLPEIKQVGSGKGDDKNERVESIE